MKTGAFLSPREAEFLSSIRGTLTLEVNAYASFFSYATAQQLILTIFGADMWDDYRPYLQGTAYPALQILCFVPLFGLFTTLIRKSVAKFGAESDHQLAARLLVTSTVMSQRLQQIKGEELIASIQQYREEQQKYLGIDPQEFKQDMIILENSEREIKALPTSELTQHPQPTQSTCWDKCPSFWHDSEGRTPLLINRSGHTSESFVT